jgi:RHS repeat-associated protein
VHAHLTYTATDPACQTSNITGTATAIDVTNSNGTLLRHRESTVDCTTGTVTEVRATLTGTQAAITDLSYRPDGNLQTVIGPANKNNQRYRLDYTYDDTVTASHVTSVVDSFGYHSASTYDPRFGSVLTSTDENNQTITNSYDSLGRLVSVTGPYEAPEHRATITFEYHPEAGTPYAVTRHVDRQADNSVKPDTIDTITFIDGVGRVIQTKADATVSTGPTTAPTDVMIVSGHVVYDAFGRAVQTFYPVTEPKGSANTTFNGAVDGVQPTVNSFDAFDRPIRTVLPDNSTATVTYGFGADRTGTTQHVVTTTDANGKTASTYTNVRGQTTSVLQHNPSGGHDNVWTSFQYDPLGQLTTTVDDQNNTTNTTYDNFGRRASITSPDAGRTDLVYDLAGNLIKKVTAKLAVIQQAIEYDYDFNRLKAIRYPVFTANNVTYIYGAPAAPNNGANRITSLIDGAGSVTRQYGPLGELSSETRTTTGQNNKPVSFTTQYQYDTWNRMLKLTYPDGEVLSYNYDSGGQVNSATGVKGGFTYAYLKRLDYDKFGQRVLLDTGNGTRTQYSYDSLNQRLNNLKANLSQGYDFQNHNNTYDNVGNITKIQNDTVAPSSPDVGTQVGGPSTQTFTYDDLNQLVHAQGSYQPRTPRTDSYSVDLTYDSINNITNKTQTHLLTSNGNTTTDDKLTYTNAYGYTGAGPHQAVTIGGYTFSYDANGNQISRVQQSGPREQMIWDEENRLACSHTNAPNTLPQTPASCDNAGGTPNDARYLYDDQGNRVVKDGDKLHIYPNGNYSTNGNFAFKHVYIGQTKLVTKTVEKNRLEDQQFYSHDDHLGSTAFVTDTSGGLAEHLQYMPGGETWVDEHPSQPVPQQFTGKEFDPETGLYYYGARYYDPKTQQWQSPDPARSGLDLYTYANNNPLRYTDPDGREPGTATVHYSPNVRGTGTEHAWIEIEVGGKTKYTQQVVIQGPDGSNQTQVSRMTKNQSNGQGATESYQFDLPDASNAQAKQPGNRSIPTGEYSPTNQCVHCVADLLREGGVKGIPEGLEGRPLMDWIRANGRPVEVVNSRGGFGTNGELDILILAWQIFYHATERNIANDLKERAGFAHDLAGLQADYELIKQGLGPGYVTQWGAPNKWGQRRLNWNDNAQYFTYVPFEDRFLPHPMLEADGTVKGDFNLPADPHPPHEIVDTNWTD